MSLIFRLLALSILLALHVAVVSAQPVVTDMDARIEYDAATHEPRIFFSWQLKPAHRGQEQSAYRIQITDGQSTSGKSIWDSGKVRSSASVWVEAKGVGLKPASVYEWKVSVWDNEGRASAWSDPSKIRTGLLSSSDWHGAQWIGFEEMADDLRVVPGVHGNGDQLGDKCLVRPVVPMLRRQFAVRKAVRTATLYITGLGHYETSLNGHKVGDGFLTPGWTNYEKKILYNIYDVADLIHQGENAIGVIVGNGFYNINRERYRKFVVAHGYPKMMALLRITYRDGSEQMLVSGPDWKTSPSAITFTSIYGGEDYDARLEQSGWDRAGFDDSTWKEAVAVKAPPGVLAHEEDHPVELKESLSPEKIIRLEDGSYLYDFGQNASGIIALKVRGNKGQTIRLTPSELITKTGQPNQSASGGPYYFSYTLKGAGVETWMPRFTYYGFRYVKVEGAVPDSSQAGDATPRLMELEFLHNRNAAPQVGTFSCSNELFNRTFDLINWAIKSNLQSTLTDCPHREKLGWMECTHLMGSAIHYNFDVYRLYSKIVGDMMDSQLQNGLVPDIAPELVTFYGGFRDSPEWGSASVILPWLIYKWYRDASVMRKAWPMMVSYVDYLKGKSEGHILSHGLGDWFDYGPKPPGEAQLTPKALTATAIYYYDLKLLTRMAQVVGKPDEAKRFSQWAQEVKEAFNAKFFNAATGIVSTGSQTAMAMPWYVGLVDDQYRDQVLDNLERSIRAQGNPLTAGDVGFHFLVAALTEGDRSQLLFDMNARDDVPGYGFQLKKGATALTESWPALENVSNNHLMLGHLMDWFYAGLGGIRQTEESVAYKDIVIKPAMPGDITWVKAAFHSPYGEIRSAWTKNGKKLTLNVSVPPNATARIFLPADPGSTVTESGNSPDKSRIEFIGQDGQWRIYKIRSGNYSFIVN